MILQWLILIALFSFILSFFYLISLLLLQRRKKEMSRHFPAGEKKEKKNILLRWAEAYDESPMSRKLKERLEQANIPLKPLGYSLLSFLLYLILWYIAASFLQVNPPLDWILATLIVWVASWILFRLRKNARIQAFNAQLPEVCRLLANTSKAGLTLFQGFEVIANEMKAPAGQEFKTVTRELQMGDPFEEAIQRMGRRIDSAELALFIHTLLIQRKLGGNIVEVMEMMASTLEQRKRSNEEIKTATAESKSIAYLLILMPILMVFMMGLLIPGFINPLFTFFGVILLIITGILLAIAFFIISRLSRIRV